MHFFPLPTSGSCLNFPPTWQKPRTVTRQNSMMTTATIATRTKMNGQGLFKHREHSWGQSWAEWTTRHRWITWGGARRTRGRHDMTSKSNWKHKTWHLLCFLSQLKVWLYSDTLDQFFWWFWITAQKKSQNEGDILHFEWSAKMYVAFSMGWNECWIKCSGVG